MSIYLPVCMIQPKSSTMSGKIPSITVL